MVGVVLAQNCGESYESELDVLERRREMGRLLFGVQQSKRDRLVQHKLRRPGYEVMAPTLHP